MTWHTHTGDRYLKRAEARLFRAATRDVLDHLDADTSDFSGTLLANHSHESLLRLFTYVGIHLLRPTEHMPPLLTAAPVM